MAKKPRVKKRWKLLAGLHAEGFVDSDTDLPVQQREQKIYEAGDIFDSECDLDASNAPGCMKFIEVGFGTALKNKYDTPPKESAAKPTTSSQEEPVGDSRRATLEALTVQELRKVASEEGVELGNASRKEDIIQALLIAYSA